jgi:ankyrin repeat protein
MAALLLSAKADVHARTVIQATPLLLAAALGKAGAMCELLLKAGADIQARDKYGNSALILAAMAPEPDGVGELLIQAGAEINAQEKGAAFAALHHAILRGNRPLVELLLARKANPNLALSDGETPLALALFEGRKEIAALLQKQGATLPPEKPMDAVERTLVEQYRKHYELVAGSTFEELRKLLSEAAPTLAEINQVFVKGSQTAVELQDRVRRDEAMAWGAANRNAEDRQNFLEIIRAGAKPGDYIRITPLPASPIAQAARSRRWISSTVPVCQLEIKRRGGETYVLGDFYRPAQRWVIMPPLAKVFPELTGQQ